MESTTSQDPAALAVQVQSLTAIVEELTRQNQEMRQRLQQEQNRTDINGDDGVDSNGRRTSTPEETNSDLLREMRKEMDELRNAITVHRGRPGVSSALQISLTSTGTFHRAEGPTRPPEHVQDNIGPTTTP